MLKAFTRNYQDNSTEAGFQFTFYCDNCQYGYKSSFIESETSKKGRRMRGLTQCASILENLIGSRLPSFGYTASRGKDVLSERFAGMSPVWQKEHEKSFERAQNEAHQYFHRCHSCRKYVCDACMNEDEGLCVYCAPRREVFAAKARAASMQRSMGEAGSTAIVGQGKIESKTALCPSCGKPAGSGSFCNNCGISMALDICSRHGAKNAQNVRSCNNDEEIMAVFKHGSCPGCKEQNPPGTRFCGGCGTKLR